MYILIFDFAILFEMDTFSQIITALSFRKKLHTQSTRIYKVGLRAAGAGMVYRITILHTQATRNHRTGCWSGAQAGAGAIEAMSKREVAIKSINKHQPEI